MSGGTIPFVALDREHAPIREELHEALARVLDASSFILGAEVEAFEREWADYCGTAHCVGVGSGTAAITLAVQAAGVRAGDEVIVPAHTYIASALGVLHAGAVPVLCDVEPGTGLIDLDSAAAVVTERTSAVVAVHLYGQVCDPAGLDAFAARHGLAVIEDAAQAHGAERDGRRAGSIGRAACFSFYPSKNLGALGDGGAICTDDEELAERARALRNIGQYRKGEHVELGWNERLDGVQASLLRVKLGHLDAWTAARREHAQRYREALSGTALTLLCEPDGSRCAYHLFPVRHPSRDALAERLGAAGVQTGLHYSPALPGHPALEGRVRLPVEVPHSTAWGAEELSLPMAEGLTADEVERAAAACREALAAL